MWAGPDIEKELELDPVGPSCGPGVCDGGCVADLAQCGEGSAAGCTTLSLCKPLVFIMQVEATLGPQFTKREGWEEIKELLDNSKFASS